MSGKPPSPANASPDEAAEAGNISLLIDRMMRDAQAKLDDIEEPTAADLAAMDNLDELPDIDAPLDAAVDLQPALALLAQPEEPEVLSLETLDDAAVVAVNADGLEDVEELLDDVETLIDDYIDVELDDDELVDEGYNLDDDDISSYHDLYGADDTIVHSFREGEFAEEEDGDTDYYNELR